MKNHTNIIHLFYFNIHLAKLNFIIKKITKSLTGILLDLVLTLLMNSHGEHGGEWPSTSAQTGKSNANDGPTEAHEVGSPLNSNFS